MSGRFFALPYFSAIIALSWINFPSNKERILISSSIIIIGLFSIHTNNSSIFREIENISTNQIKRAGIADERKYYFSRDMGLFHSDRHSFYQVANYKKTNSFAENNYNYDSVESICGGLGISATNAGPNVYFIDTCALANPLLAKLPFETHLERWRIGHFSRNIPLGYKETIESGDNVITDKNLHKYYEHIELITRGDLFSKERLVTILNFHLGKYDHLLEGYNNK